VKQHGDTSDRVLAAAMLRAHLVLEARQDHPTPPAAEAADANLQGHGPPAAQLSDGTALAVAAASGDVGGSDERPEGMALVTAALSHDEPQPPDDLIRGTFPEDRIPVEYVSPAPPLVHYGSSGAKKKDAGASGTNAGGTGAGGATVLHEVKHAGVRVPLVGFFRAVIAQGGTTAVRLGSVLHPTPTRAAVDTCPAAAQGVQTFERSSKIVPMRTDVPA